MQPGDIGVVLAGGMRSHQENYAAAFAAEGCRLLAVGLADGLPPDEVERHRELAESLSLPLLSLEEAVRLPGAVVASIAVRMRHRAAVVSICARAGLHLYLDKPLAGSVVDAAAIANAVAVAGVQSQVFGHVTATWAQQARAIIREGRLGRLLAVHADMLMAKGSPAPIPTKRRAEHAVPDNFPEDIAKRELTDMGVYPVSLVAWLLGTRAVTVNAVTANHFFAEHESRDVEDYGAMLLQFEDGVVATITCGRTGWGSYHAPFLSRVILVGEAESMVVGNDQDQLLVTTTAGPPAPANTIDPMGMWLSTRTAPRPTVASTLIPLGGIAPNDVAAFVAALVHDAEPGITAAAALHHCEILAAAYRSAAERREVAIGA